MGGGEVLKEFEIALDITRSISNREFSVVEGDTGNVLHILLTDDGEPVNLSGCRVLAIFSKSTGTSSQDSGAEDGGVCIGGTAGNEVTISLFSTSFAPGMVECELQIYSGAALKTLVTSAKFNFTCRRGILNDETVQSTGEYPLLVGLMAQAAAAVETADAAAAAAYAAAAATGQAAHASRHAEGGRTRFPPLRSVQRRRTIRTANTPQPGTRTRFPLWARRRLRRQKNFSLIRADGKASD